MTDSPTDDRPPNPVLGAVEWLAGLLVPLWMLWAVRPWVAPESEAAARARTGPRMLTLLRVVRVVLLAPLALFPGLPVLLLCLVFRPQRRPILLTALTGGWLFGVAVQGLMFAF